MFGLNLQEMLLTLPWILLALSFHEFCHAWVSHRLGDPTPEQEGRLSLNPFAHIDPIGFIFLLFFRFGWAKPVQINPYYYKNPMRGTLWVSLAGPGANFILAILFTVIIRVGQPLGIPFELLRYFVTGLYITLGLGFFNLIPIPPLDGSKVLRYFLKGNLGSYYDRFEPFGMFILLFLLVTPVIGNILPSIIEGAIGLLLWGV